MEQVETLKSVAEEVTKKHGGNFWEKASHKAPGADFFLEAPNFQDTKLYEWLRACGFQDYKNGYEVPYKWLIKKNGVSISYVEGDIYVNQINEND